MDANVDACVVGAGPAGSIAAARLAEAGASVLLVDAQQFPRYKSCAAGVLWHDIEDFPEIKPVIECFNYELVTHSPSLRHEFSIASDDHYLMGQTYRATLDDHLARLAVKAGAEFRDGCRATGLALDGNARGATVTIRDKATGHESQVHAKVVIGADGVTSMVRKAHPAFPAWRKDELLIASELDVPMGENRILDVYGKERRVHMFLYFGDLPGYAWIFTKKNSVSIGMGTMLELRGEPIGGRRLAANFAAYCDFLAGKGLVPREALDIAKTSYALIPCVALKDCVTHAPNALLAGDAAGAFVSALSGEGIYYGMLSGKFAAETCIEALKAGDFSTRQLSSYETRWSRRLRHELNYQHFGKRYMVEVKRRCEKAVRWGQHDASIKRFMSVFFTGAYQIDRSFAARLVGNYIRLKVKDRLGMLGEREKRSDYPS